MIPMWKAMKIFEYKFQDVAVQKWSVHTTASKFGYTALFMDKNEQNQNAQCSAKRNWLKFVLRLSFVIKILWPSHTRDHGSSLLSAWKRTSMSECEHFTEMQGIHVQQGHFHNLLCSRWGLFMIFLACGIVNYTVHYITLHSMDPKLVKMTVGCGIRHTITKTHIQYNWSIPYVCTQTYKYKSNTVNLHYVHRPLRGWVSFRH
jgi:hypothetical protein